MTCIVGIAKDGKVYLGGDSAGVAGLDISSRKDKKVFRNGEFVLGFTSSFRMGQILQYEFKPPEVSKDDLMEYMVCDFVPEVRKVLKDQGYAKNESGRESGGTFLVGFRGRLFEIQSDFQVAENICGYSAVGCGEQIALGAMFATATSDKKPEERVEIALEAAAAYSAGVRAPFNFVTT